MPIPKTKRQGKKVKLPEFREGVKLSSYCPICEASYDPKEAKLLGAKHDSHLMHVTCGNCLNAILTLVLVSNVGVTSVGLLTDLMHDEIDRFKEATEVSVDDVIEAHCLLQDDSLFWRAVTV